MEPMRILLAVDGSPQSEVARDLVASIDWPAGSSLNVVTVLEPVNVLFGTPWAPTVTPQMDDLEAELTTYAESILEEAARAVARTGCRVEREVIRGRPASAIVERAAEWDAQLIVMGSRGHGRITSMLLGSVSAEVVDHATCPVLVARLPLMTRVVLAHDGSPFARHAEELVADWPIFRQAAIEVTSVAPGGAAWRTSVAPGMAAGMIDHGRAVEAILEEHTRIADEAAARLRAAGLRATSVVVQGQPAEGVIAVADGSQADLIAMGTHGRTGMTRVLLGSVARNVMLHARCSVLIARQAAAEASEAPAAGADEPDQE
jgi:nucleotide-binding universal stress UspA family protein